MRIATIIGTEIIQKMNVKELLVTKTIKNNTSKLKPFAILTAFMGTGFPDVFFFLNAGTGTGNSAMEASIRFFLSQILARFQTLKPLLFSDRQCK